MTVIARRPVKIEGLNPKELEAWINQHGSRKAAIKCQLLIALCNGSSMTDVCKMFNVTRESVRGWRNLVVSKGPNGLVSHSFRGRTSQLTPALKKQLKKIMANPPHRIGYKKPRWSGKLLVSYLEKEHNVVISIRTAQLWMKLIKK
jgi:transposase